MVRKILMAGVVGAMAAAMPIAASAGILGTTVDVIAEYPFEGSVYADGGPAVVGPGLEYAQGSFADYNSSFSIDLSDNQISIYIDNTTFSDATFNGFAVVFGAVTPIGASINDASTYSPVGINFVDNILYLNFQDVIGSGVSVIDLQFGGANGGVPEPATWAMMLLGFGAAGAALRTRRGKALAA